MYLTTNNRERTMKDTQRKERRVMSGVDGLWGMYQWLDRAPKGRNETGVWWRRHDEYSKG
jgi:predicted dithiol-disulfide oxidoreductase (DUF899 family)